MPQDPLNNVTAQPPLRIGVSACLLGEEVRYDGGHKRDRFLVDTLSEYFEFVPVCPEAELGLGIPRPTIRLETLDDRVRLVMPSEQRDLTDAMQSFVARRVKALVGERLSGFVLKKGSPSCGLYRVKLHKPGAPPRAQGTGIFAGELTHRFPDLPVEEEGRLHDARLRENWITRVFAYGRLQSLWSGRWTLGRLVAFHTAHKLLLLAHSPQIYRQLGSLVAEAKSHDRHELRGRYQTEFMSALGKIATPAKNTNVLEHMLGHFKKELDGPTRREILEHIHDYRRGYTPLVVPLTLIAHYVKLLDIEYLRGQVYLYPHPRELALRCHV